MTPYFRRQIMLKEILNGKGGETRFAFISGKGGVGKTTVAAAIGLRLAKEGLKTLIVSTDIQRSLDDVFAQEIAFEETPISGAKGLFAVNVDPARSLRNSRERIIKTLEALDPDSIVLSHMKVDEKTDCGAAQAPVFEMNRYLNSSGYDVIVFDTAPTGIHLEKMLSQSSSALSLAKQWAEKKAVVEASGDAKCSRALADLKAELDRDKAALEVLASGRTSYILITIPENMPFREIERNLKVLEETHRIPVRGIVVNQSIPAEERERTDFWRRRARMQDKYAALISETFSPRPIGTVPLMRDETIGLDRLQSMGRELYETAIGGSK
jgi:arsenite-transporting ATPase